MRKIDYAMNKTKKPELLAPAGSFECLCAAVQSGADAVYFAGKAFGARAFADNFDNDNLKKAIDYCHIRDVKTHIAVNTAVNDKELQSALELVSFLYSEGADALIVSDIGLASEIKKYFPDLPLHASTQMTIHNTDGAVYAQNMGFDRVVLSRELSYDEIRNISHNTSVELEIFAHGALCMCYSGQCLLSSVIGGRSGNKGSCAQPCRLPFSSDNAEAGFYLSLKDMCLIKHLKEVKNTNVASLKIEGRMKGAAYVAAVTQMYRRYLDEDVEADEKDYEILEKIFFRGGLTDRYFTFQKGKEMFDFKKPDNPYLKQTKEITSAYEKAYVNENNKKLDLHLSFYAHKNDFPVARLKYKDKEYIYKHRELAESAHVKAIDAEFVKKQLNKTGGTPYCFSVIDVDIDDDIFIGKSVINEIRRNVLALFGENYIKSFKREKAASKEYASPKKIISDAPNYNSGYTVYVSDLKQLDTVLKYNFERIYVPVGLMKDVIAVSQEDKRRITAVLPEIMNSNDKRRLEPILEKLISHGFEKLLIHNIGQLCYSDKFNVALSHRFNIFNGSTALYLKKHKPVSAVLSPEITLDDIAGIKKLVQCEYIVYGHIPVMITENCIVKNLNECPCDEDRFYFIKDRKGIKFPVKPLKAECRSVLYNSVPIYLADKLKEKDILKNVEKQIFFTVENQKACEKICEDYLRAGECNLPKHYTRGNLLK